MISCIPRSESCSFSNCQHIHSIDGNTRYIVTSSIEISDGGCSMSCCTHSVSVIFAQINARQFPQCGHIVALIDLSLIGSTISKCSDNTRSISFLFGGQSNSRSDGNLCSDDTISSIKVVFRKIQMHRTSFTSCASTHFPKHFSENTLNRIASRILPTVVTICGDNMISRNECILNSDA